MKELKVDGDLQREESHRAVRGAFYCRASVVERVYESGSSFETQPVTTEAKSVHTSVSCVQIQLGFYFVFC